MDNIYLDTYYFFVPNRLVWNHWREFNGENTQSAWIPTVEYEVPTITSPPQTGWTSGTIADYMGIPINVPGLSVNALPIRAYALIMNEWFRDENLSDPLHIPVTDNVVQGSNGDLAITDVAKGGKCYRAAKFHDYFTSCLPAPQKGPDVTIPVSDGSNLPVMGLQETHSIGGFGMYGQVGGAGTSQPRANATARTATSSSAEDYNMLKFDRAAGGPQPLNPTGNTVHFEPTNLWAIDSGSVSAATINQLRMAFQIQKLYEKDARGGSRYIEILKSHFGVTSPDARLQRPEYLGGNRIPININQVVQQSATQDGTTPQGNPVGLSMTSDSHGDFSKSFVEHGFVIGLMVSRYDHTYQQGLDRFWSRKSRFDYYWPVFANIGEQAVKNKEIYAQGNSEDDEVFGYQEAWADYRYKPSRVTGEMRSTHPTPLDVWHLADDYDILPSLSDSWIRENKNTVDRVLAIQSSVANQIFCDIFIQNLSTRPMPLYSIPGLIDHH